VYPLNYLQLLKQSKQPRAPRHPIRVGIKLALEALEDRWLPNGTITPSSAPPPSFNQAAIQLFNDGVNLGVGLVNQHVFGIDEADAFPVSPAVLNANIAFNSPYAGSFAPLFVLAGEIVGADVQYQMQLLSFQTF
jgi:hypothetical protein